ncbi:NUDIX hydrolase [Sphingomonas sp.]|uniref:NUDIX hydrolase n=1 Tax=Sphingomonas sp. TaxID=28214 RepID=UPI0035BBB9AE
MPDAIPAATLIVFRETSFGPPEILMVERARAMAFAAGALVFPGGRIDPGDVALAAAIAPERHDAAARIAAIRETIEEAGIAIGLVPPPSPQAIATMRAALHAGQAFGDLLDAIGATLDLYALVVFARWLPAHAHARIFDTHFYLARLPADAPPATVDTTENVHLRWATASQVLTDADAGAATIIFPTRRNLERLAGFANFAAALADAGEHPVRTITPFVEAREGIDHLCIPDDLGYPITSEPFSAAVRG